MNSAYLEQAFNKANKFIKKGDFEKAITIYDMVLEKFPKNFRASKAIKRICPQSTVNDQNYLVELYNKGQINEGILECEKLIQKHPHDHYLLNFLGIFYHASKRFDEAEYNYQKSLKINNKTASIWSNLSVTQHSLNQYKESIDSCKIALNLEPGNAKALNNLGHAYFAIKEYYKALDVLKKSISIEPGEFTTLNNLGNTYQKLSLYDEAIYYLDKALKINNQNHDILYNIASAYRDIGKFDLAINNYIKSVQLNSANVRNFTSLMELCFQIGLWGKFKAEFLNIIKLNNYKIHNYFYSIYNLIYSFTAKDFSQTEIELKKLNSFVNESEFLQIKEIKDKVFILAYFNLIKGMLDFFKINETEDGNNIEQIYHIGESHSLAFSHCSINRKNKTYKVEPRIIFGLKAWHLSQESESRFKSIFKENIKSVPNNSKLLISIGEIDCRKDEGIIHRHLKSGEDIDTIIQNTISGYLSFIRKYTNEKNLKPYFFSVPAPVSENSHDLQNNDNAQLSKLRISVVEKFNQALKVNIKNISGKYIDTHSITTNKNGSSNKEFMVDEIHLHPKIFNLIEDQII